MAKITLFADARGNLYYNEGQFMGENLYQLVLVDECDGHYTYTGETWYVTDEELAEMTEIIVDICEGNRNEHICNDTYNDTEWTHYWGVDADEYEDNDYANEGEA